jgi:hypothetical protein
MAAKSPTIVQIAELSAVVVSASDGAPEATFVFALLPKPAEALNWKTIKPQCSVPESVPIEMLNVAAAVAVVVQHPAAE